MIRFILVMNRQGRVRLARYFVTVSQRERARHEKELAAIITKRRPNWSRVVEWKDARVVYKRYASLFVIVCHELDDNALLAQEEIHHLVVALDRYFGNVCELDLVFRFHEASHVIDELFVGGFLCETSQKEVVHACKRSAVRVAPMRVCGVVWVMLRAVRCSCVVACGSAHAGAHIGG